jgi:hypothetical protein
MTGKTLEAAVLERLCFTPKAATPQLIRASFREAFIWR